MINRKWLIFSILLACSLVTNLWLIGKHHITVKDTSQDQIPQLPSISLFKKEGTKVESEEKVTVMNYPCKTTSKSYLNDTFLLVMIPISPGNFDRRKAIRDTWLKSYETNGKKFFVKFVIGSYNLRTNIHEQILKEQEANNDILLLEDHYDSYYNLTRKVLQMFVWANEKVNFSYFLKIDDDCFPRLDKIEEELKKRNSSTPLYWGFITKDNAPLKEGKWKEDKWDLCDKYLPYAMGGAYILSRELVHNMAINSESLQLYQSEDVSVGLWVSPFVVERKKDWRIHPHGSCKKEKLNVHVGSETGILAVDKSLKINNTLCH